MRRSAVLVAAVLGLVAPALLVGSTPAPRPVADRAVGSLHDPLASVTLGFEPNRGQAPEGVEFVSRGPGFSLSLTPAEAVLSLGRAGSERGVLRLRPVGANPHAELLAERPLPGHTTHLAPGRATQVLPSFAAVRYRSIYPGVDLVFYGTQRRLEHDFVVSPGADPSRVNVELDGAEGLGLEPGGSLAMRAGGQPVRLERPRLFQDVDGTRRPVKGEFRITGPSTVGFRIGAYDRRLPLVIDPVLVTSSYLGGKGTERAAAVAVDAAGSIYVGGTTDSSDFPVSGPQSSLNQSQPGTTDAFVTKIAADGRQTLFSTYLGGSAADSVSALALTADGGVVLAGDTGSGDLPRGSSTQGGFGGGQGDGFVAKLKPDGTGLAWSLFLGGGGEDSARGLAVDAAGAVFVAGSTNSADFASNGLQAATPRPGDDDAFVVKVNPAGTGLDYAARLGGTEADRAGAVAVDGPGNAYLTGETLSAAFPTQQPIQDRLNTGAAEGESFSDAFVAKLDPAGRSLVYSSYLGGSQDDHGLGIAVDPDGAAYVAGTTSSPNLPTKSPVQGKNNGESDAFVAKLNPAGNGLDFSTYFGGSQVERAGGIALDGERNALVAGTTSSSDLETAQPLQAEAAGGASEAFLFKLDSAGVLHSSTFLGGEGGDQGLGLAVTGGGTAFVVGATDSSRFPVNGAFQERLAGGGEDSFVARVDPQGGLPSASAAAERHQRRLRLLLATTVLLFLVAGLQTLYLRRRPGPDTGFGVPVVVPNRRGEDEPDEAWEDDVEQRAGVSVLEHDVPVPDIVLEEPSRAADNEVAAADVRTSGEVIDDTAFWALFPSDVPPPSVPPARATDPAGAEPPSDGMRLADLLNAELPSDADAEIDLYAHTGTHSAVLETPDEDRFFDTTGSNPVVDPDHDPFSRQEGPDDREASEPAGEPEVVAPVAAGASAPEPPEAEEARSDDTDPWAVWRDQPGRGVLEEDELDEVWTAWTAQPEPEADEDLGVDFEEDEEEPEPEAEPEVLVPPDASWPGRADLGPVRRDLFEPEPEPEDDALPDVPEPIFEPVPEPAPARDLLVEPEPEPEPEPLVPWAADPEPDEPGRGDEAPEASAEAAWRSEPESAETAAPAGAAASPAGTVSAWSFGSEESALVEEEPDTDLVAAFVSSDPPDSPEEGVRIEEISIEDLLAGDPEDEPVAAGLQEASIETPPEHPAVPPAAPWADHRPASVEATATVGDEPDVAPPREAPPADAPVPGAWESPLEPAPQASPEPESVDAPVEPEPEAVDAPVEPEPQRPQVFAEPAAQQHEAESAPGQPPDEPERAAGGAGGQERQEEPDPGLGSLLSDAARWLRGRRRT